MVGVVKARVWKAAVVDGGSPPLPRSLLNSRRHRHHHCLHRPLAHPLPPDLPRA